MEKIILVSDTGENHPIFDDPAYVQVLCVSSTMVKVTDEGHCLLSGQLAYVANDSEALKKALSRGLVILTNEDSPKNEDGSQAKKKPSPKAKTSVEVAAVPAGSDEGLSVPDDVSSSSEVNFKPLQGQTSPSEPKQDKKND